MVNGGIWSGWLTITDEERGDLWKPARNFGYRNRGPQAISWEWGPMNSWPKSGFMSGDPSVPLCALSQDAQQSDSYGPWNLGISGHQRPYFIRGTCKDSGGNPLGGAVVQCFRTSDDLYVSEVACDDRGVYEVGTPYIGVDHYLVALYASGNLAGSTVNTLRPSL